MKPSVNSLDSHLGHWLRFGANQVARLKVADRDATVAEWVVLRELFDADAMMPSTLA